MRVALYVRVSTADGRQDTANQLNQLREFCRRESWTVVKTYQEHASAKSTDREAFKTMMEDARKHKFDILVFWSLDRLSRGGALVTLQILNKLTDFGVKYRSYSEQYIDSCGLFRDAVISILATIGQQERVRISERTKAGLARQRITKEPGPNGQLRGGAVEKQWDKQLATKMRKAKKPLSAIAAVVGISKPTLSRFFRAS